MQTMSTRNYSPKQHCFFLPYRKCLLRFCPSSAFASLAAPRLFRSIHYWLTALVAPMRFTNPRRFLFSSLVVYSVRTTSSFSSLRFVSSLGVTQARLCWLFRPDIPGWRVFHVFLFTFSLSLSLSLSLFLTQEHIIFPTGVKYRYNFSFYSFFLPTRPRLSF